MFANDYAWAPVAAAADRVVLQGTRLSDVGAYRFRLIDPRTGTGEDLWVSPEDAQDTGLSSDGDWLVFVRTGNSLPLSDWTLTLRNWRTGEVRELARSDSRVPGYPDLHIGLPNGFAPQPELRDGIVVWDEYFVGETYVGKRIQRYDIESGTTTTVAQVDDARLEEVSRPTHARSKTAWIRLTFENGEEESVDIRVEILEDGAVVPLELPGRPYIIRFSFDAGTLYWDDDMRQMKRTDLATMETMPMLTRVGDWPFVSGRYVGANIKRPDFGRTWVGYFDEATGTTYTYHIDDPSQRSTVARPVGKWFVWTLLVMGDDGSQDLKRSALFFLPLD